MSGRQIQQIQQYLQGIGSLGGSDKLLKQAEKHPQAIWEIFNKLCGKLKNTNIDSAYSQMFFMLEQSQKHQQSCKWLKPFMHLRDLSSQFGFNYTVLDFFRPDRDRILNLLFRIIEISRGVEQLQRQYDELITRDQLITKELVKQKNLHESTVKQLEELKQRKTNELPLYLQQVNAIEEINNQITSKRQKKLEVISSQKYFDDELSQKEKLLENDIFQNQNRNIQIQALKKDITLNAPQVKKEKRAIQDEFSILFTQVQNDFKLGQTRYNKISDGFQQRNKSRDILPNITKKIVETLNNVKQFDQKQIQLTGQNERICNKRQMQFEQLSKVKQQIQSAQISLYSQTANSQNQKQMLSRNNLVRDETAQELDQVRQEIKKLGEQKKKFDECNRSLNNQIQSLRQKHQKRKMQLRQQLGMWCQKVVNRVDGVYSVFQKSHFK